jgi:hypothetical protein
MAGVRVEEEERSYTDQRGTSLAVFLTAALDRTGPP